MNFFEELVHDHLTGQEGLFARPDLKVEYDEEGKPWSAQVDILALDLSAKRLYFVEVNGGRSLHKYFSSKLAPQNRSTIEAFVNKDMNLPAELGLSAHWRIYVRRALVKKTEGLDNVADLVKQQRCEVKALEDIMDVK